MFEKLSVNSWVSVTNGCPMRGSVVGSDAARFAFGEGATAFEFDFDAEALRRFSTLATQALQEMDERHAREETGEPVSDEVSELALAGQDRR
jgi:hypothetical protein